jgi:predicted molibdopterin-dependent oxidoreductase YjgC
MYIMGENPMMSDPNVNHVREALESLDFLVVQDLFLTETAQWADVVLPSASFAEKDGTFTNTGRRVQRVRKALDPPGQARTDGEILQDLAARMGYELVRDAGRGTRDAGRGIPTSYPSSLILEEIASLTPSYGGMAYDRLEGEGLQWPCPDREHPGTPILHREKFTRGLGRFTPVDFLPPAEWPDEEYPFLLSTGRMLYHFHTGSMTRRSRALDALWPDGYVEMNPQDAARLGLTDHDPVRVVSRRGEATMRVRVTDRPDVGSLFAPFHFAEGAANLLTNDALDPTAKIPEYKVAAVWVEKVAG